MRVLKILVKNPVKKDFMKKWKIVINILTIFYIFHKIDIKIFLKWILNECLYFPKIDS